MNEKRMKTSVNTGELSSLTAQGACWGVKVRAEHGCNSEKPVFGVEKWLAKPREGMITAKMAGKINLPHEDQVKQEIPGSVIAGGSGSALRVGRNVPGIFAIVDTTFRGAFSFCGLFVR